MSAAALSAAVLGLALALFLSERVRHDLVAVLALGSVSPDDALRVVADPAVIAVASVLVVGRAVEVSGVAGAATRLVLPPRISFAPSPGFLMAAGAVLSAFMDNIAALVITMPLATEAARRAGLPPGAALMPLVDRRGAIRASSLPLAHAATRLSGMRKFPVFERLKLHESASWFRRSPRGGTRS